MQQDWKSRLNKQAAPADKTMKQPVIGPLDLFQGVGSAAVAFISPPLNSFGIEGEGTSVAELKTFREAPIRGDRRGRGWSRGGRGKKGDSDIGKMLALADGQGVMAMMLEQQLGRPLTMAERVALESNAINAPVDLAAKGLPFFLPDSYMRVKNNLIAHAATQLSESDAKVLRDHMKAVRRGRKRLRRKHFLAVNEENKAAVELMRGVFAATDMSTDDIYAALKKKSSIKLKALSPAQRQFLSHVRAGLYVDEPGARYFGDTSGDFTLGYVLMQPDSEGDGWLVTYGKPYLVERSYCRMFRPRMHLKLDKNQVVVQNNTLAINDFELDWKDREGVAENLKKRLNAAQMQKMLPMFTQSGSGGNLSLVDMLGFAAVNELNALAKNPTSIADDNEFAAKVLEGCQKAGISLTGPYDEFNLGDLFMDRMSKQKPFIKNTFLCEAVLKHQPASFHELLVRTNSQFFGAVGYSGLLQGAFGGNGTVTTTRKTRTLTTMVKVKSLGKSVPCLVIADPNYVDSLYKKITGEAVPVALPQAAAQNGGAVHQQQQQAPPVNVRTVAPTAPGFGSVPFVEGVQQQQQLGKTVAGQVQQQVSTNGTATTPPQLQEPAPVPQIAQNFNSNANPAPVSTNSTGAASTPGATA